MTFKEKIIELSNREPVGKEKIPLPGGGKFLPYHEIPLEYLKFNFYNNRISTQAKEYRQIKAKELSQIPFEEANEIVENWIWDDRTSSNQDTLNNILEYGQMRPGIITSDGTVVGGNRRLTILRRINREQGKSIPFNAVILKDHTSEDKAFIKELEAKLQHAEDAKMEYSTIQPYLRVIEDMEDYVHKGLRTEKWVIKLLKPTFKGKTLDAMYGIGKLMQEYLEYVEMDNLWSRITIAEDLFIKLYTNYSNYSNKEKGGRIERSYDNDDLRNYKYRGFDLIRFRQNLSSKEEDSKKFNAKLIRDLYYKDSKDNSLFSNEKIFDKFNSTIEDAIDNVDIPSVEDLVENENGRLNETSAAEQIDKLWVSQVKNKFKEALGTAITGLDDNSNKNQPQKYLDFALSKLYNLVDEDVLIDKNSSVLTNDNMIQHLKSDNEIDDNLDKLHRIRKIVAQIIKEIG